MKNIIITCGDPDGIGAEITIKALRILSDKIRTHQILVFVSENSRDDFGDCTVVTSINEVSPESPGCFVIFREDNPTLWVRDAVELCTRGDYDALVTGPLSKSLSRDSSLGVLGHTDLFRKRFPEDNILMCFLGSKFNVALVTDHIPIRDSTSKKNIAKFKGCIDSLLALNRTQGNNKPLAVVGINPHAGEEGLLGSEDNDLKEILDSFTESEVIGPLVPDAAFQKQNWDKYSFYVCLYHDQGLIPFKMIHGQETGIQLSLGLPFLRTSVDHGTAKDIFGLNQANPNSMVEAIEFCL